MRRRSASVKTIGYDIYIVGGGKGGVGKSFISISLVDYLVSQRKVPVSIVECDQANSDFYLTCEDIEGVVSRNTVQLSGRQGWGDLINIFAANSDSVVVVNTASGNNLCSGIGLLDYSVVQLGRKVVTLWPMNRQRDSVQLLKSYLGTIKTFQNSGYFQIHAIRNGYFGDEGKFELYNNSETRIELEAFGGKSLTFPDLADRVVDQIYNHRIPVVKGVEGGILALGDLAELIRWREEVKKFFDQIIY